MRRWRLRLTLAALVAVVVALVPAFEYVLRAPAPARAWAVRLARPSAPVSAGPVVAVVDGRAELFAFERRTGERRWVWRPGVPLSGALAYASGDVFAGLQTGVCAVRVDTGLPRWCEERAAVTRVAAGAGVVLVLGDERVTALSPATGVQLWTRETPDVGRPELTSDGGELYLAGPRGVVAMNAATGETRWRAQGAYRFRPHVFDGTLYLVRSDTATDVLEARFVADGSVRYVSDLGGRGAGGPARSGSLILLAGERAGRGWLQAFGTRTGQRRWRQALDDRPGPLTVVGSLVAYEQRGRLQLRETARGELWGGRDEPLRAGERPVRNGDVLAFRLGRSVRAVRV